MLRELRLGNIPTKNIENNPMHSSGMIDASPIPHLLVVNATIATCPAEVTEVIVVERPTLAMR